VCNALGSQRRRYRQRRAAVFWEALNGPAAYVVPGRLTTRNASWHNGINSTGTQLQAAHNGVHHTDALRS